MVGEEGRESIDEWEEWDILLEGCGKREGGWLSVRGGEERHEALAELAE